MRSVLFASLFLSTALLAACGKDETQKSAGSGKTGEQLPAPASTGGGVTGMPDRARAGPGRPAGTPADGSPAR